MEEKVLSILRNVLEIEDINNEVSRESCAAWDSLKTLNLMIELEMAFNVTFEPEDLERMESLYSICNLLTERGAKE